ncbi:hypothetical protein H8356DRAFT_1345131 [Neocallimastix lanati (nom. inval.)]|nr:hypothetical protein H8356DRAFT_1345131 [Neocallimastix sp. JGI-2020a]
MPSVSQAHKQQTRKSNHNSGHQLLTDLICTEAKNKRPPPIITRVIVVFNPEYFFFIFILCNSM